MEENTQPIEEKPQEEWQFDVPEDEVKHKSDYENRYGSRNTWDIARDNVPIADHPLARVVGDAMGEQTHEAVRIHADEIANIVNLAVGIKGTDSPEEIYKFIRHQMRMAGQYGHTYRSLALHLQELAQEFI